MSKKKKKIGRPPKYKKEFCDAIVEYFSVEPYEEREIDHYDKDGNVKWTDYKRMSNRIPTLRGFAKKIKVDHTTVYQWVKDHPEFSNAFTRAQELRKWFIIENGLEGTYNPTFAIFVAKNITDMKDKVEHEIEVKPKLIINDPTMLNALRSGGGDTENQPDRPRLLPGATTDSVGDTSQPSM